MKTEKIYGLIGKSLEHSFSRKYFTKKFEHHSLNAKYVNFEIENVSHVKRILEDSEISGLNVTIPYKEEVMLYLDEIDEVAAQIGAVNTIQFRDGKTKGYNTDCFGFKQLIKPFFKSHHERAMILGTGGASKAVAFVLEDLGCQVIFISRKPERAGHFAYQDINELMVQFNALIVNTTPLGMYPNIDEMPDFPVNFLSSEHLVIDLIYNPEKTKFMELAEQQGATVINGKTMLQQQAEKSWEIWNEK